MQNVQVGSQVSGNIQKLFADFNSIVKAGQVIAQIDPVVFQANVNQAEGDLENTRAALELARLNAARTQALVAKQNSAQSDLDQAMANLHQAEANVKIKEGALEKAKAALDKNDFVGAGNILEACKKTYGEAPEIKQAAAELEAKRVAVAKTKVDKAIKDARTLLLARQYIAALKELESVVALVSAAPPELQKQYETIKKDASAGAERLQKEADLGKTIVAGSDVQTMVVGSTESAGAATARAALPGPRCAPRSTDSAAPTPQSVAGSTAPPKRQSPPPVSPARQPGRQPTYRRRARPRRDRISHPGSNDPTSGQSARSRR